jgi:ketosteroid isomerase-like protein
MAQSNAELVKDYYGALGAGEPERAIAMLAPDVEIRTRVESHRGIDSVRKMLVEDLSEFDASLELTEVTEAGPNAVIACYRLTMRGLSTGIDSSQDVVDLVHFRDGLVQLVEVFSSREEALASLDG